MVYRSGWIDIASRSGSSLGLSSPFWKVAVTSPRHMFGLFAGLPVALHAIAVGYVSVDSHLRHMKRLTWALLSAIPGGLGLVFYFLVRRPLLRPCRACSLLCKSSSIFCVHCCCRLQLACERCHLPVDRNDRFCATCGQSQMQLTT